MTPRDAIDPRASTERRSRQWAAMCGLVFMALLLLVIARLIFGMAAT